MYTVLIADDEPTAVEFLRKIIERRCPEFQVIATANDGSEAYDRTVSLHPDVVCLDIQMPVVNGLELSGKISRLGYPVTMVAISGYTEFDYVREAMRNGVMDYINKPLVPSEIAALFEKIEKKLLTVYAEQRTEILRAFSGDKNVDPEKIRHYFGDGRFYLSLSRDNGLPARFTSFHRFETRSEDYEVIFSYGRDENESLMVFPEKILAGQHFRDILMHKVHKELPEKEGFRTVIYSREPVSDSDFQEKSRKLYRALDDSIILGKDRVLELGEISTHSILLTGEEQKLWSDFLYYVDQKNFNLVRELISSMIDIWEQEERPLLWVERRIRSISAMINIYSASAENYGEKEYELEDAFMNSINYQQLKKALEEVMFEQAGENDNYTRLDTEDFAAAVCNYINTHLSERMSVQGISREFGVSVNYLGRIFRKYRDTSISEYMTASRINRAIQILSADSDIMIKDLAQRVGYTDQFYFSRVFRARTGKSPSDYLASEKNAGQGKEKEKK